MCCLHVRTVKNLSRKRASAVVVGEDVHVCTYQVPTCSYLVEVSDLGSFLAHFLLVREDELLR